MTSLFVSRLHQECHLFKFYWWKILIIFVVTIYFCSVVARNLAFMHHHPLSYYVEHKNESLVRIKRLEDIGFKILPDWSNNTHARRLNDFFAVISPVSVILFSNLTIFLKRATTRKVFAVNIIVRFVLCYVTTHLIRACVYLTTSLPGPASHCIDSKLENANKPRTLSDIFISMNFPTNCGDLLYSGHMAGYVTGFCTMVYYVEKIFGKDEKLAKYRSRPSMITNLVIVFYIVGMLCQIALAIGTRQHYTVDTMLAIIAGYWNFIWHQHVLRPTDMDVPKSIVTEYQKENYKRDFDNIKKTRMEKQDSGLTQTLLSDYMPC